MCIRDRHFPTLTLLLYWEYFNENVSFVGRIGIDERVIWLFSDQVKARDMNRADSADPTDWTKENLEKQANLYFCKAVYLVQLLYTTVTVRCIYFSKFVYIIWILQPAVSVMYFFSICEALAQVLCILRHICHYLLQRGQAPFITSVKLWRSCLQTILPDISKSSKNRTKS